MADDLHFGVSENGLDQALGVLINFVGEALICFFHNYFVPATRN